MNNHKNHIQASFQLLQSVFRDAFHVPVLLFTPPYQDISEIDQGIRASIWPDYSHSGIGIQFSDKDHPLRLLVVKSNLGFYNVLVSFRAEENPDFLSIGPFRKEELSSSYYIKILKDAHVPPASIQGIKYIYEQMPVVSPDIVVKMTKDMLLTFFPDFVNVTPEYYTFTEQNREVSVNLELLEDMILTSSEHFSQHLLSLMDTIQNGHVEQVADALHNFLDKAKLIHHRSIHESKLLLHTLNNYCQLTLLQTSVHPVHTLRASLTADIEINKATSSTDLNELPLIICERYCKLAKEYTNSNYSKLTRDVIAYIQLHLEDELSLHHLAAYFGKNPSVLSSSFHQDTGETLTRFIHKTRIKEAARLLHNPELSVSDVAIATGYQDFSYFSKIFSREMGCSPRAYQKKTVI